MHPPDRPPAGHFGKPVPIIRWPAGDADVMQAIHLNKTVKKKEFGNKKR